MKTSVVDVMRRCYERGWISTRDGNVSVHWRNGEEEKQNWFYITPSGERKNVLRSEDLIKVRYDDTSVQVPTGTKPSGELEMHYLLQSNFNGACSVVHVHATHIVAAMYAGFDLSDLAKEFPEVSRYTRVGHNVPNLPATSSELATATWRKFVLQTNGTFRYDVVGQANHGVTAIGKNPWDAYEHIERLNHICEIVLLSGRRP